MDRVRATPFMERHPRISLATVIAALLLMAVALGAVVGNLGASVVELLSPT